MNKTMHKKPAAYPRQSGAALVVGLILLVAMTLLALASMNTASLDLVMAGNEQSRARAFAAAESGIEQGRINPAMFDTNATFSSTGTTSTGETYTYEIGPAPAGSAAILAGTSINKYVPQYFVIKSTATTIRNTSAEHTQEVVTAVLNPNSYGGPAGSGSSSSGSSVTAENCLAASVADC